MIRLGLCDILLVNDFILLVTPHPINVTTGKLLVVELKHSFPIRFSYNCFGSFISLVLKLSSNSKHF